MKQETREAAVLKRIRGNVRLFARSIVNLPQVARVELVSGSAAKVGWMTHVPYPYDAVGRRIGLAIGVAAMLCGAADTISKADAQTFSSSYTSTAPKDCRVSNSGNGVDDSTVRVCPGKAGLTVLISEDDLREIVSVGRNRVLAAKEPAAEVWFAPFNSSAHTVEWRALDGKPFAIIQRWRLADHSERDKEDRPTNKAMLAVTRLPPGPVCHVAYVDVQANSNPNELARKAADEFARDFNCGKDKVKVIGESGRAVEMATKR